ncbi:MAG TPA: DUF3568 family protein [Deltaproteobacteria bacterium]|nr:DUF3568 family protein [Deltaproteobacteria bacterium]
MFKNMLAGSIIAVSIIISVGCAIQVGDSVMGVKSEGFFYTDGILRTNYHTDFERVWDASIKALKQLNIQSITEDKKISKGTVTAMTYDEEIRLTVEYLERNITQVGIRVGVSGSAFSSQIIHDKIKNILLGKE